MALTDGEIVFVLSNNVIAKTFVYKPGLGHLETIALLTNWPVQHTLPVYLCITTKQDFYKD